MTVTRIGIIGDFNPKNATHVATNDGIQHAAGFEITGKDEKGEARIVELRSHPFFAGTLFVPQARSKPQNPHPLILAFCRAASGDWSG